MYFQIQLYFIVVVDSFKIVIKLLMIFMQIMLYNIINFYQLKYKILIVIQ